MERIGDGAAEEGGRRRRARRRRGDDAPETSGEGAVSELRLALSRATRLVARRLEGKLGPDDLARAALELDRLTRAADRIEKLVEAHRSEGPQTLAEWMADMVREEIDQPPPAVGANGSENKDGNDTAGTKHLTAEDAENAENGGKQGEGPKAGAGPTARPYGVGRSLRSSRSLR